MKKLLLPLFSILIASCGSTATTTSTDTVTPPPNSETSVITEKHPETKQETKPAILIGKQPRKALEATPYATWFSPNYDAYNVDSEVVQKIKPLLGDITIKVFMGTWCGDSKRETPTFYKILDAADYDYKNLELITVDRSKKTPSAHEKGLDIQRVPTFIFYKDGKEIGRYVEYARETLEKDMLAILSGKSYKHAYED
ncbi:thioredoxin family protein [Aquimarina hainanensis]|uniref:Thioredoxin family protein n=1 Tax=Aquimarina hainanensis TaxID=1578017 RepID=A0ABW5N5L0_9FLAO|nr:thioredoxin family protein [Aquimarina sp. TRL1]QKX05563.1 thioredoxin family protein [Aquimarina sp. TRL1]